MDPTHIDDRFMTHPKAAVLFAALFVAPLLAQDDEARFRGQQADKLNKFAKKAYDKGFPRQARLIWLQVLKLYDDDNVEANTAIGNKKVGSSWNKDPGVQYPTRDTGKGSDGQALFKGYAALSKTLANGHRAMAKKWAKAGRTDRANKHWQMVLRWSPDDGAAQEALERRERFGGLTGTALEKTLYERSKMIERLVQEQSGQDYPVEKIEASCAPLDRAQVDYVSMQSESFILHGDPDQVEGLEEALRWAERTRRVCEAAFPWKVTLRRGAFEWAFFQGKETYQQILEANRVSDLEWKKEHTSMTGIGNVVIGAVGNERTLLDAAVRNVAQTYAGFGTDGFREGIGHTFVGMMFNNNRLFSVDLKKQQGTVASEEDREYTSPDFDVWKTLNLELAWKSTGGVPARDLPFCDAAAFTNEERIKAWSFCDYVMRRDPALLRAMDRLGAEMVGSGNKRPLEFEKRFNEANDAVTVAQLDREWEDFWTEATSALKAIQNNTPPLAAVSKGVEKWLAAFNGARQSQRASPVKWSTNLSTRCHDHALYLKVNKRERGPAAEHRELVELGGSRVGDLFAQMAIVETKAKVGNAKKMFRQWLAVPGYRDALIHDFLLTVGIYTEGDILVMNVVTGLGKPLSKAAGYTSYPRKDESGIPTEVNVADLGPELEALLEANGHAGKKRVGYPLTLHFGMQVPGQRKSYQCRVEVRGKHQPGLPLLFDDGKIRLTTAPGMVTFYPLDPLPKGDVTVIWSWEETRGPQQLTASFQTR